MAFLTEAEPPRLVATDVAPGVRRMVAPNPGPMTYTGTNTWLVDEPDGLTVIDPGPDDPAHLGALAASGRIARILLTHTHPDHAAGAPALRQATGAPVHGWRRPWAADCPPDIALDDGDRIGSLQALHTPGHAPDHLCFARAADGLVFTGDHVMSWSTSMVPAPPDGDMAAYMDGLRRLLAREDALYLPGHGPPLPNPLPLVRAMLSHRVAREASVLAALARGRATADGLVEAVYPELAAGLKMAARRTLLAHLAKLVGEGRIREEGSVFFF